MKEICLNHGKTVMVDDMDFEYLNQWKWREYEGYAVRNESRALGHKVIFMHRLIAGTPKGMETDHKNMNGLDNQRSNIRICTHAQNCQNCRKYKRNTSGYKGVSLTKYGTWQASICVDKKHINLGRYHNKQDAILAYRTGSEKYHGDFARLE